MEQRAEEMECQMWATNKGKPLLTGYRLNEIITHESTGTFESALIKDSNSTVKLQGYCNSFRVYQAILLLELSREC